ncbi:MAG: AlkA N-terminal domain-containing protein [Parvibaculum sp.]
MLDSSHSDGVDGLDANACYAAVLARDTRFDGRFFTGVKTTGIYCRPICPARIPKRAHCTFYPSAAAAETVGFRACLRCRPEAAPGTPAAAGTAATVTRALRLIQEGALDRDSVGALAERLGLGERQVRRLFATHLGASPEAVGATRRLLAANQLLRDTDLPISDICFAAGFRSLRRFNDAFATRYKETPSAVRARAKPHTRKTISRPKGGDTKADDARAAPTFPFDIKLRLGFRPPFDWGLMLDYFRSRLIPGVEVVTETSYRRSVSLEGARAFIEATADPTRHILWVRVLAETPFPLAKLATRARQIFDLDAQPAAIAAHFTGDPLIGPLVAARPGLRVPGAYDGFELGMRAILGQQVSVKGASTLAGRLVMRYGTALDLTPGPDWPTHLFPTPEQILAAGLPHLATLGLPSSRAATLFNLGRAVAAQGLQLNPTAPLEATCKQLLGLKGMGAWTVSYIALRALSDPDAFPEGDLGLQKAAAPKGGRLSAKDLRSLAQSWRPWRGYAALHLWTSLASE